MVKSGFKNPIEPVAPKKKMKSPWNYDSPQYDERSSCFVNAGSHYGVGFNQPVGHEGDPKAEVDALPRSRYKVNTMRIDEVPYKNETLDVEE